MQRLFKALFIGLALCVITSCSWFLGDYDGPTSVSHGYVEGVTPSNATLYNDRTYPTVQANWPGPGGDKIWLGVNLGATGRPQTSVDTSPSRAGWFFQFNRKQAFYHNGGNLTPQWKLNSINENSVWDIANDPCRILLGGTWRLPTIEELRAFRTAPVDKGGMGEGNRTSAFNSTLKLHAAGKLHSFDGALEDRGISGNYWASDQFNNSQGEVLGFSQTSNTFGGNKAFGRSVRCVED
jgi:hypothetical protein